MDLHATQPQHAPEQRGGSMKFTYPSGSRPLEGYTIKRGIGQGGFGEVYYATSDAGKEVALKLIRRNLDVELRGVTQCLNLRHASLLALYDIKQDERGDSWVVMEYIAGESLEDVLAAHPQGMPIDQAMTWFHGIASGVAYLHDRGIVHRDLKPGNIFNDEGQVKIGDYGLSKFISASRRSGQTESVGTVHYMAPEISNGRYGKEIDIYALGVILYEFLTGRVPFEGESVGEVLMKHLTAEPDLSMLAEPYRAIVKRALHKDPNERIHSVAELLEALPAPTKTSLPPPVRREYVEAVDASPIPLTAAYVPPAGEAPVHVAAVKPATDEEPIWRAIREAWGQLRDGYQQSNFSTPTKVVIWVVGIYLLIHFFSWSVLATLIFGGITYGGYRIVRAFLLANASPTNGPAARRVARPVAAQAQPRPRVVEKPAASPVQPVAAPRPARVSRRSLRNERAMIALPLKSPREQVTELLGSLLLSAGVSSTASIIILILSSGTPQWELFVWLAMAGTAASWGVLIPAKFWEGTRGDPVARRFVLLASGLVVGLAVWAVDSYLKVNLTNDFQMPEFWSELRRPLGESADVEGQPNIRAYLAYFGFLFLAVRWWRQADPLRSTRLSLWATLVCVIWAAGLGLFWPFPEKWGMILGATTSVAIQLSSPWLDPRSRAARPAPAVANA